MPPIRIVPTIAATALLAFGQPSAGPAGTSPAQLCLDAATAASRETGVPEPVLLAIALVETGRAGQPWPWTVAVEGTGHWLDSAAAAATRIEAALAHGVTNIDIGCFQLNYRWHATAFASVEDMLDPQHNALYAAEFLSGHHDRTGDWADAAAAYHSATPVHAEAYRARFKDRLAGLDAGTGGAASAKVQTEDLPNRFPLLVAGTAGARGSLVPAVIGGQRLIGAP